jgi:hypothetical protein
MPLRKSWSPPLNSPVHLWFDPDTYAATDEEVAARMPGDEFVPQASFSATRSVTIGVAPDHVWPWLLQLGFGRAGWCTYDLFDNVARPSARRILPGGPSTNGRRFAAPQGSTLG